MQKSPQGILGGSIAGWASNTEVRNCNANSTIYLMYEGNKSTGRTIVGGLFGYFENNTIYSGVITGDYKAGGFIAICGGIVGTKYNAIFENINSSNLSVYGTKWAWLFGGVTYKNTFGSEEQIK